VAMLTNSQEYYTTQIDRIIDATNKLEMSRYGATIQITAPDGTKTNCMTIGLAELKKIKTMLINKKGK
jgi:hypothetical protein